MFIKEKNYDNAIQKVRIEVGTLVGAEEDKEVYLVLKELPTVEIMNLRQAFNDGEMAVMKFFQNVLPKIIVEHNFYVTEQKKMTNEEVVDFLFEKIELSTKVMNEYSDASFFTHKKKTEDK